MSTTITWFAGAAPATVSGDPATLVFRPRDGLAGQSGAAGSGRYQVHLCHGQKPSGRVEPYRFHDVCPSRATQVHQQAAHLPGFTRLDDTTITVEIKRKAQRRYILCFNPTCSLINVGHGLKRSERFVPVPMT